MEWIIYCIECLELSSFEGSRRKMIRVNIDGKYKTIKINYVSNEERLKIVELFSSYLGGKSVDYDKVNDIQKETGR